MSTPADIIDNLDSACILQQLDRHACALQLFDKVDSTNDWLLQQCREGAELPLACFADAQTAGRGRRGKAWHSPARSNLYMSLGWSFANSAAELGAFSLLTGVAVVRALKHMGIERAKLKWPNDVLVDHKKLAGILIETQVRSDGRLAVIIGIGVNYQMSACDRERINQPCTDVCEQLRSPCDRNQLAARLLIECIEVCRGFPQNTAGLLDEYRRDYDALSQQNVTIHHEGGQQQSAVALSIENNGALRVQIDGVEHVLMAADVSLRSAP